MKLENIEDFMLALERGQVTVDFMNEIRKTLAELKANSAHGDAKGGVTLKIGFVMRNETFSTVIDIASKTTKPKRRATTLWVDDDGTPCTSDPRQVHLFERESTKPKRSSQTIDQ